MARDLTGWPVFFIVYGGQRTGSTLIRTSLNGHPGIVCFGEVLLPWLDSEPSLRGALQSQGCPQWIRMMPAVRRRFLESLWHENAATGAGAVGVKIMYNQISLWPKLSYLYPPAGRLFLDSGLLGWLRHNEAVVVHTLRRNHLKMVVSHVRARQTGEFHRRNSQETGATCKVVVPVRGLMARLRRIESAEKVARAAVRGLRTMDVYYEDYIGGKRGEIEAGLCAALGQPVPASGLTSPLRKVSSDDLRELVANYDEIAMILAGTRYEGFLT